MYVHRLRVLWWNCYKATEELLGCVCGNSQRSKISCCNKCPTNVSGRVLIVSELLQRVTGVSVPGCCAGLATKPTINCVRYYCGGSALQNPQCVRVSPVKAPPLTVITGMLGLVYRGTPKIPI